MKALAFGEILFDVFPDRSLIGGAPLNVAAHLRALAHEAVIVSALGTDELGDRARDWLLARGFDASLVQTLPSLPTGIAAITLERGIADYEFNEPCAWDRIDLTESPEGRRLLDRLAETEWDAVVFGSLSQRNSRSRASLAALLARVRAKTVFYDVNMRKSFYDRALLETSFRLADIVKLNDDELKVVRALFGGGPADDGAFLDRLCSDFGLEGVLLTRGKEGVLARFGGVSETLVPGDVIVADTVGAGDSFSAGFLAARGKGFSVAEALSFAGALADFVVSRPGAIPDYDEALKARLAPIMG